MKINYGCPYWGSDFLSPYEFIDKAINDGYNGVELFLQPPDTLTTQFIDKIENIRSLNPDFFFVLLQLTFPDKNETIESHIALMKKNLHILAELNPLFINSHTGRDHFSFDDNCKAIDAALNFAAQHNIRILHETHRGRFSFHTTTLLPYLQKFPELELVGDLSHFCTVSESMLEDQEEKLQLILPHIAHIHARIGFEQSPQINDPSAPEWSKYVDQFIQWWNTVLLLNKEAGKTLFTITPEFGPVPYMPVLPFTQNPLSNQWDNNLYMLNRLKNKFGNQI